MNKSYWSPATRAVIVAVGLSIAGQMYPVFDGRTAFYLDMFDLILPFFLVSVSVHVITHRRRASTIAAVSVSVGIVGLSALTVDNVTPGLMREF